ncbi:MAG: magnesium transporter [Clostridia bacterium]|jgi:magnesium transporter|nr:magnesium transporter [Clostridia bacterium]
MEFDTILKIVGSLLAKGEISALRSLLSELNVVDTAAIMEELEPAEKLRLFRILPKDVSADIFSYLETDSQTELVAMINDHELESLLDEMFLDDTVDFLEEVPANVVTRVLRNTDAQTRKMINRFLRYPESSAGSIMTIEMVRLLDNMTAAQAIASIRENGVDKETVYTCYVTDAKHTLLGAVPLLHLLLCDENTMVRDIMQDDAQLISVNTLDDREEVADIVKKYDLLSVPVVDNEKRLVGIVTVDDIVDVIEEEATEDIEKMASLAPSDDEYLKTGVFRLAGNRILWLLILMLIGTVAGLVVSGFEKLIAGSVALVVSIPIITATSGNAGSQSSTLMIRGLMVGEIKTKDYWRIVLKEIRVAAICGAVAAAANMLRSFIPGSGGWQVCAVVSAAMFVSIICAKLIGCSLPMLAKLLKSDPATVGGPLIQSLSDITSLAIYFGLASLLTGILT